MELIITTRLYDNKILKTERGEFGRTKALTVFDENEENMLSRNTYDDSSYLKTMATYWPASNGSKEQQIKTIEIFKTGFFQEKFEYDPAGNQLNKVEPVI